MSFRFVGGPLDGLTLDHNQINAVGDVWYTRSESGLRNFLTMPSPEECGRLLRGGLPKGERQGTLHVYQQLRLDNGSVEYHEAGSAVGHALREQERPLDAEQQERKRLNAERADQFQAQLRLLELTPETTVLLIRVYSDRQGHTFRSAPAPITSTVTVSGYDDPLAAQAFALASQREALLANIDSLVRHAPTDFMDAPGSPSGPLVIHDFELLVE